MQTMLSLLLVIVLYCCSAHYKYNNPKKDDPVIEFAGRPSNPVYNDYTEESHLLWLNTSGENKCSDYQFAGLVQKQTDWYTLTQSKPLKITVPKSKKLYLKTGWDTNNIHEYCRSSPVYFTPKPNTHYTIDISLDGIHCNPIIYKILPNGKLTKQAERLTPASPCKK